MLHVETNEKNKKSLIVYSIYKVRKFISFTILQAKIYFTSFKKCFILQALEEILIASIL